MREISAKVVGSVVLVLGAMVALAAGVLLPILGGGGGFGGFAGTAPTPARAIPDENIATSTGPAGPSASKSATRVRKAPLAGALAAAAKMPASTDMVLVVDNAADLRGSPVGDAAVRFLVEASGMAQTREAWSTLASQLGWSETEMFDRLLGKRVVLVARGFGDSETARWALLSDISIETDTRLKEKLEASQRAIDQGHQILTLEKGKYELTSHRRRRSAKELAAPDAVAAASEVSGDDVTIVLGPAGKSELFDEMVGVLASGSTEMLAGHEVITAAGSAGASEVLLLARLGASDKPGVKAPPVDPTVDRWADFFVLAGGRAAVSGRPVPLSRVAGRGGADVADASEFTSRVIYRDRGRRDANMAIAPTSDAAFRSLISGSLLTIVQAAPVQQVLGDAARLLDALRDLPLPEPAQQYLGARQVLSLREIDSPGEVQPEPIARAGKPSSHLVGVLALETKSTVKLALLDASITRFIAAREQQFGVTRPPPHDFGGRLPGVTRVLPLDLPDGNPLRLFVPDPLTLAWSYPASGSPMQRSRTTLDNSPGWWVMSITPTPPGLESLPEQAHNAVAAALSQAPSEATGAKEARWIWLGHLRAADLEKRLPGTALIPDIAGFRSAMKRFEHVRIELSINSSGDIQGDLTAKLAQTPAK